MLTELTIRDFTIIDHLNIRLHSGFNVFTGETGAGKSILIDALELLMGGRSNSSLVRAGVKRALIEGRFRLIPAAQARIAPLLEENGLEGDEPDLLLLGREVRANGRSVSRVNGRAVTLSLLREVADGLVDIHGQSEHLSLLKVRAHVGLLDRYAELDEPRQSLAKRVRALRRTRRQLKQLLRDERAMARRADLLQFQVEEIGQANLELGEEEELGEERNRLANAEQLATLAGEVYRALQEAGDEGVLSAIDLVSEALRALTALARIDASMADARETLESVSYQLDDLAATLLDYQETIEYNPRRLTRIEDRLDLIYRLKRKYGDSIEEILAFAKQAAAELEEISHSEERVEALQAQETKLLAEIGRLAVDLSAQRRQAAERLAAAVEAELEDLRMPQARFRVDFQYKPDEEGAPVPPDVPLPDLPEAGARLAFDETGVDQVEFLVAPNPGEGLKPLVKIASGGETSRLMLALKTVLSRADETPILVFDEIDQGIGGRVGSTVGEKLWCLTADDIEHQVLCVTHLPQLAGYGDFHFKVEKNVVGERTVTSVRVLDSGDRIEELAQMLGALSTSTRASAREILAQVKGAKE